MMKYLYILIFFNLLLSCKNDTYSDNHKNIVSIDGNTDIYYKNSFLSGKIKDSIAALNFDKGLEQASMLNFEKSKNLIESANRLEPGNNNIINALGNIYADLKNFDKSYEYYEKAIKIDSLDEITYMNYGHSRAKNNEFLKAIELYNKGIIVTNSDEQKGYLYYNISRAYYQLYQDDNANLYIDRAIKLVKDKIIKKELLKFRDDIN